MAAIPERKKDIGGRKGRLCLRELNSNEQATAAALPDAFRHSIGTNLRQAPIILEHLQCRPHQAHRLQSQHYRWCVAVTAAATRPG